MTLIEIVMFIVPGFLFIQFEREVFPSSSWSRDEDNGYYFLLKLSTVGLINTLIISFLMAKDWLWVNQVSQFLTSNEYSFELLEIPVVKHVAHYGYPMLIALAIEIGFYYAYCFISRLIMNWDRKRKGMAVISKYDTIWDKAFEKNKKINGVIVEVEQNGQSIIRGYISQFSGATQMDKELEVLPSRDIEIEFEEDAKRSDGERVLDFDNIEKTFFNLQTGTLVKFYDSEKANANIMARREAQEKARDN